MKYVKRILIPAALLLQSCIVVPKRVHEPVEEQQCHLFMPSWTIKAEAFDLGNNPCGSAEPFACLVALGVVLPVGSTIVSGSVAVAGNTLRWLEYQGRCDESEINRGLAFLQEQLDSMELKIIDPATENGE